MARKPQMTLPGAPTPPTAEVEVLREDPTWQPTKDQRRAKAKLTVALRDDPLLVSTSLSGPTAASIVGVPAVETWWRDPRFRGWFLDQYEAAARAEELYTVFLDEIAIRMPNMSDKDILSAGKLLSEVARKMPEKHSREKVLDAGIGSMSPERLRQFIVESAGAIGLRLVESEEK